VGTPTEPPGFFLYFVRTESSCRLPLLRHLIGHCRYGERPNSSVLDSIYWGYRLPKPDSMPEAVYRKVVQPCWIYQDESTIKEMPDAKSSGVFTGRATFAQIDNDLAAIIELGGVSNASSERTVATSSPCDFTTVHVAPQPPCLSRNDVDGSTEMCAPNTDDGSTGDGLRVTAGADGAPVPQTAASGEYRFHNDTGHPTARLSFSEPQESMESSKVDAFEYVLPAGWKSPASNVALYSDAGTAVGRARDTSRASANHGFDLGNGCGTLKTRHLSAAAFALHNQPVGGVSNRVAFIC
jgi:hypothetical protein